MDPQTARRKTTSINKLSARDPVLYAPCCTAGRSVVRKFLLTRLIPLYLLLLGACPVSQAADVLAPVTCVLPPEVVSSTLEQLDAVALECLKSPAYFRQRGHLETVLNLDEAALESFEKALMLAPDHAGTQVDYVQALIVTGDEASARDLLTQLLARNDVPVDLRPGLERQAAQLAAAAAAAAARPTVAAAEPERWHHRVTLNQSFGYDTNLNNAFSLSSLVLTGPQGNIELEVDPSSRAQSGGTTSSGLQWIGLRPDGESLWVAQADVRNRHTASQPLRYAQGDLALTWLQAPEAARQWILRTASSNVRRAGSPLYSSRLASALYQWSGTLCRPVAGIEVETRRYLQAHILDGGYNGLALSAQCPLDGAAVVPTGKSPTETGSSNGFGVLGLGVRLGTDRPYDELRAGGSQQAVELRARWQGKWAPANLQVEYVWQRQRDQEGYSPLLANDAVRRLTRNSLRFEASTPLSMSSLGSLQIYGTLEFGRQRSNIEIFNVLQTAVTLGLRWAL